MLARKWRKRIFVCCLWECRLVQALWKTVWKFLKILKIELPYSKVSACNAGDPGSIPGSRRSPGEGNGNPLQYSCLGNSTDRGDWWATIHGVAESWTQLSNLTHTIHQFYFGVFIKRNQSTNSKIYVPHAHCRIICTS